MFSIIPTRTLGKQPIRTKNQWTECAIAAALGACLILGASAISSAALPAIEKPVLPDAYLHATPLVHWPIRELVKRMPELKGFDPAPSQDSLEFILEKVGENVQAFFHNFLNTASKEEIYQIRMGPHGGENLDPIRTNYLLLGVQDSRGVHLEEYRTNTRGVPIALDLGPDQGLLTHGFASLSIYFDPAHQARSSYEYLGEKSVDGRRFLLVAFAQRPELPDILAAFNIGHNSVPIMVQGVAWIDSATYQIARMKTDLLAPLPQYSLNELTTDITYIEVFFKESADAVWLPRRVTVTVKYRDLIFHNEHHYSNYRLFNVDSSSKASHNSRVKVPR